jgi:hypothetical protein
LRHQFVFEWDALSRGPLAAGDVPFDVAAYLLPQALRLSRFHYSFRARPACAALAALRRGDGIMLTVSAASVTKVPRRIVDFMPAWQVANSRQSIPAWRRVGRKQAFVASPYIFYCIDKRGRLSYLRHRSPMSGGDVVGSVDGCWRWQDWVQLAPSAMPDP